MRYKKKTRTKGDYKPEFAGLQLPEHPVSRYKNIFSKKYQRLIGGNSANTPQANTKIDSCCFACLIRGGAIPKGEMPNRIIWEKKANARWLNARWIWDSGFTLPAGLSDYGVGISPPIADYIANKSYIFPSLALPSAFVVDGEGQKLEFENHNIFLKTELHYAKLRVMGAANSPTFLGELAMSYVSGKAYLIVGRKGNGGTLTFFYLSPPTSYPLDNAVTTGPIGQSNGSFSVTGSKIYFNIGSEAIKII